MTQIILAAQGGAQGGGMSFLIMMVAIFAIMYFFMIRPQQKQRKKIQQFQNSLTEGKEVVTGGGLYGKVKRVDVATGVIDVEIAHGVTVKVDKNFVYDNVAATMQTTGK